MKDGLENIDEVFKQAFEGFEANVDPSVWTNVQNAIGSGAGATDATPKIEPSTVTTVATNSIITKIAVGVALVGGLGTAGYFVVNTGEEIDDSSKEKVVERITPPTETEYQPIEKVEPKEVQAEKEELLAPTTCEISVKDDFTANSEKEAELLESNSEEAQSTAELPIQEPVATTDKISDEPEEKVSSQKSSSTENVPTTNQTQESSNTVAEKTEVNNPTVVNPNSETVKKEAEVGAQSVSQL